ncbi:hypothetical protein [Persephonella sp.]
MKKILLIIPFIFTFACGGGGSSEGDLLEGYFYDAPVEFLDYKTSSGVEGTTDSSGKFFYRKGDVVKFYVGDLLIGETSGDYIVSPLDLFSGYKEEILPDDPMILDLVSFFLYLDSDSTDFIITVDETKIKNLNYNGSLTECIFNDDCPQDIKEIILQKRDVANAHFSNSYSYIMTRLSGCYDGNLTVTEKTLETFCDISNSPMKIFIKSNGTVNGYIGSTSVTGDLRYKDILIEIPSLLGPSITIKGKIYRNNLSGEWSSVGCGGKFFLSKVDDNQCLDIQ